MTEWTVVLGSASPARAQLLRQAGIAHRIHVSNVDELTVLKQAGLASDRAAVVQQVRVLAEAKARDVASALSHLIPDRLAGHTLTVGADSLFEFAGRSWGKPSGAAEVLQRWEAMMGRTGVLHTAQTVISAHNGQESTEVVSVQVRFAQVSLADRQAYARTAEAVSVAGAFTLDGLAAPFIAGVHGDPSAVIGLSLPTLRLQFETLGIEWTSLWGKPRLGVGEPVS